MNDKMKTFLKKHKIPVLLLLFLSVPSLLRMFVQNPILLLLVLVIALFFLFPLYHHTGNSQRRNSEHVGTSSGRHESLCDYGKKSYGQRLADNVFTFTSPTQYRLFIKRKNIELTEKYREQKKKIKVPDGLSGGLGKWLDEYSCYEKEYDYEPVYLRRRISRQEYLETEKVKQNQDHFTFLNRMSAFIKKEDELYRLKMSSFEANSNLGSSYCSSSRHTSKPSTPAYTSPVRTSFTYHQNGSTSRTYQNCDGSSTTYHQNGSTSRTYQNCDGSSTTYHQNGSTSRTYQNPDGSSVTYHEDGSVSRTYRNSDGSTVTHHDDGSSSYSY